VATPNALTAGFHRALLASSIVLLAAALVAVRAPNTRGEHEAAVNAEENGLDVYATLRSHDV
jgi:hypothetical protein